MYNIFVNDDFEKSVIVCFEEMVNEYPDLIEDCEDILSSVKVDFSKGIESIDEPQDYYYVVTCCDEDVAGDVEAYLEERFSNLEEQLED